MPPRDETGILFELQQRRPRYVGGSGGPAAHAVTAPRPLVVRPIFEKGRYISPKLIAIMALVARHCDVSIDAISGGSRVTRLVNARYCIAKLSEEFAPRLSGLAVDSGMLRGEGSTLYYRSRHEDRCKLFPDYEALYRRCRAELLRAE